MNRINRLFQHKPGRILSVYFTAGHPTLDSAPKIIKALANAGADMIEIGMPFSDPMADGPVIQTSSNIALKNGMNLKLLFNQLKNIRNEVDIPLLMMGYINPVLQYGLENFSRDCAATGIDGMILPDLPIEVYEGNSLLKPTGNAHQELNLFNLFNHYNLISIFLISPQTAAERVRKIDAISKGFIYMVSSSSTTGVKGSFLEEQVDYFKRIGEMKLKNPTLVGFGISNHEGFETVCKYASGAIVGSAFVKMLSESGNLEGDIRKFVEGMKL
jgi:tryptophan synthase alpha chain